MYEDFIKLQPMEKLKFILSALGGNFICEWGHIYVSIINFVHDMYQKRKKLIDDYG